MSTWAMTSETRRGTALGVRERGVRSTGVRSTGARSTGARSTGVRATMLVGSGMCSSLWQC